MLAAILVLPVVVNSAPSVNSRKLSKAVDEQQTVEIASPRVRNPIAPSEKNRGKQIADASDKVKLAKANAKGKPRPHGLESLENVQPLFVQHHDEGKSADPKSRKAEVFYFDYSKNESIKVIVNLKNNTVEDTIVARGVANQPFFTRSEITAALQLIYDHPQMGPNLRKAYQDVTGQNLDNVNKLDAQGGVFFPDIHTPLGGLASDCLSDRCIQLFIPINDKNFIETSNLVVNLSKGEVLWVNQGLSGHTH